MVEYLKWDSDFFGYKIGKITVNKPDSFSDISELLVNKEDYRLIYLIIDEEFHNTDLQERLEKRKIKRVDTKTTFSQIIPSEKNFDTIFENTQLYLPTVENQKLIDISLQGGIYSRFKTDKNFVENEYEKLYTTWIKNSVNKKIADRVIVAYQESEITGLITLAFKDGFSDIGLVAVDSNYRGQEIGKKLIQRAIYETTKQSIKKIKVVTQKDNVKACNFYKKQNFTIEKLEYIYHVWF